VSAPPALPTSDPEPQRAGLPGGVLTYADEGPRDAPALLAVHGIPGSLRDFRYLAPQLTHRLRVIRLDLPGFGGSAPVPDAVATLAGRARVVVALADHLGLDRFAVLGHSMGGGTALVLASTQPARILRLVLVASVALSLHRGLGMRPGVFGAVARAIRLPLLGPLLQERVREGYRRRRFPGVDQMSPASLALQLRMLAALDFGLLRRAAAAPLPPTLMAYSRDDHMLEPRISEELARALPQAQVLVFDSGGHNLQKTRAVELGEAIVAGFG
jgi:pimeloyl-ACP methyl ester carboxylesterase